MSAPFNQSTDNYAGPIKPETVIGIRSIDLNDATTLRFANRMNIIRFLAIASIIWGHSTFILEHHIFNSSFDQYLQAVLLQTGKIGTILFFLISGFFLAGQIGRFNMISYLRYRMVSVILPWFIFLSLAAIIQIIQDLASEPAGTVTFHEALVVTGDYYRGVVFYGAYWFIPVSIFSSIVLISLKRNAGKLWVGAVLLSITVFYSINLHFSWISTNHTKAFLGYAFFMWLGISIKNNIHYADKLLSKISWSLLLPLSILLFALACIEGFILHRSICADPYASIRFSNALFCIALFFMLIKTRRMQWINSLNPHANGYGLYLAHSVIILMLFPLFKKVAVHYNLFGDLTKLVGVQVVFYALIMLITYLVVIMLAESPLAVIIGRKYNPEKKTPEQSVPTLQIT